MSIQLHPLVFATSILVWLIVYHAIYALAALLRDPSLAAWSIGPLGLTVIPMRAPRLGQVLFQLTLAAAAVAAAVYGALYIFEPSPISGLDHDTQAQIAFVALPVLLLTVFKVAMIVWDRRFPIWGEARILACVQRSLATGAVVIFTPRGRAFLRERFGATPHEFLRMVRY